MDLNIPEQDILSRLAEDNPWWSPGGAVARFYTEMPRRSYFQGFHSLLTDRAVRRAVLLMGPRRVGKTVLLHQAAHELLTSGIEPRRLLYVSVDTPTYSGLPLEKLVRLFLTRNGLAREDEFFVLFDEIQYLKDWEVHLKSLVDSFLAARFAASGSAAAALKRGSRESGAGRFTDFILPPLTFAEYLRFIGREKELTSPYAWLGPQPAIELNREFVNYINFGGYPEAVMSPAVREDPGRYIRNDIIDKVLLRDLPSLYGIRDIQELNRLFATLAYNTGNEVSLDALAQSSGVAKNTLKKYLEYLEAAFLIVRVPRVGEAGKAFQRAKFFKVYLTNPAMRAALFMPVSEDDPRMGNLVETAIFSQVAHLGDMANVRYARWKGGEVDLVFLDGQARPSMLMEIKWSDRVFYDTGEIKGLVGFARRTKPAFVNVATKTVSGSKEVEGVALSFSPCSTWCHTLGKVIVTSKMGELAWFEALQPRPGGE
ncbi:MAG: ATP-binding protein [Thermodesulfobacteriota bacterium]